MALAVEKINHILENLSLSKYTVSFEKKAWAILFKYYCIRGERRYVLPGTLGKKVLRTRRSTTQTNGVIVSKGSKA